MGTGLQVRGPARVGRQAHRRGFTLIELRDAQRCIVTDNTVADTRKAPRITKALSLAGACEGNALRDNLFR